MARWRIGRLEQQTDSTVALECVSPEIPIKAVMLDTEGGPPEAITFCWNNTVPTATQDLLDILHTAGYTPNDWE